MSENPFGNPAAVVGEVMPQQPGASGAAGLVGQGQAIQQMRDSRGFATAISVQRARDSNDVERRVTLEAAKLGENAFYSWPVKDKRTGRKKIVEGLTIGAAMSLLGEWGNCVIDSLPIQELSDVYIFTAACIDLERGVTVVRPFKLSKGRGVVSEKYDDDRAEETRFATAASKAARNAVLQLMPTWLTERMMAVAKEGVRTKLKAFIDRKGIAAAQDYAVEALAKYGITSEAICEKQSRAVIPGLTIEDLIALRGDLAAIQDGVERPETLFPPAEGEKTSTDSLREELTRKPEEPELSDAAYNDMKHKARCEDAAEVEPDDAKLKEVMERKKTPADSSSETEPTASVDLVSRRKAIRDIWIAIPKEDRPSVLKNLTLKGKVKKLTKLEDIEDVDNDEDLTAVQESFVDAQRKP